MQTTIPYKIKIILISDSGFTCIVAAEISCHGDRRSTFKKVEGYKGINR